MIGVFTSKIIFHFGNLRIARARINHLNNMAGDGEDGRIYVLLLFITVFMSVEAFQEISCFPQVVGATDGSHNTDYCAKKLKRL